MSGNTTTVNSGEIRLVGSSIISDVPSLKSASLYGGPLYHTVDQYYLSDDVDGFGVDYWPPHVSDVGGGLFDVALTFVQAPTQTRVIDAGLTASFSDDFYHRIHVIPTPINFGAVFSLQSTTIRVWNAYLVANSLNALIGTNSEGVTVTGAQNPPTTFNPTELREYSLAVDLIGPPSIDALFEFQFSLGVGRLQIYGTRILVFPFEPNWQSKLLQRLEWNTDILEARDGSEQRMRMRQNPRMLVEYRITPNNRTLRAFNNLMFGWQGRRWGVPLWFQEQALNQPLNQGATFIPCATSDYSFQVGGSVILYLDTFTYESARIKTVLSNQLEIETPLTAPWPKGTRVMPIVSARMSEKDSFSRITADCADGTVQFISEDYRPTIVDQPVEYQGYPVFKVEPNWIADLSETWERRVKLFDNTIGQSTLYDLLGFSHTVREHSLLANNLQVAAEYRKFIEWASGRWKSFWYPSATRDLRLTSPVQPGQNTLLVEACNYSRMVNLHSTRRDVAIKSLGQAWYRRITAAVDLGGGVERLTLDQAIPGSIQLGDDYISFMSLSRLDSDAVEFSWINNSVATIPLLIKGVKS